MLHSLSKENITASYNSNLKNCKCRDRGAWKYSILRCQLCCKRSGLFLGPRNFGDIEINKDASMFDLTTLIRKAF